MPVIQTNVFICEADECETIISESKITTPYNDPVVVPPRNEYANTEWEYIKCDDGVSRLLCIDCVIKHRNKEKDTK